MSRPFMFQITLIAVLAALTALPGYSQTGYPTKNIRIIVPYGPGGNNDFGARSVATPLADALGQSVVVDNRPGAAGIIGTKLSATVPADGYTFSVGSVGTHAINMSVYKNLPYNVLRDFIPITDIFVAQNLVVVHPSLPVRSIKELIAFAKSRPGKLNYGSAGTGTTTNLSTELFKLMTGVNMVHVPYKGGGASIVGVLSGEVSVVFASMPSAMTLAKAGRLRPLAVTGSKHSPTLPDLPTVAEAGVPGYEFIGWVALFAPTGTPRPIVSRIYTEVSKILRLPKTKQAFFNQGVEVGGMPPNKFAAFVKAEIEKWAKVVKQAGVQVDLK